MLQAALTVHTKPATAGFFDPACSPGAVDYLLVIPVIHLGLRMEWAGQLRYVPGLSSGVGV